MTPHLRQIIFERFAKKTPHPKCELIFKNHFELLIAVMLSAQATDISVNKVTPALFAAAPTPQKMIELGLDGIIHFIQSIGLFNSKAKHVMATCLKLINEFNGEVPHHRAQLESLPGVGRKTANVVLNTAFGLPTIAVDTHIFRVSNRTGLARGKTPLAVEMALLKSIPSAYLKNAHHWLILHGRYTCTARKPKCDQCLINDLCEYPLK